MWKVMIQHENKYTFNSCKYYVSLKCLIFIILGHHVCYLRWKPYHKDEKESFWSTRSTNTKERDQNAANATMWQDIKKDWRNTSEQLTILLGGSWNALPVLYRIVARLIQIRLVWTGTCNFTRGRSHSLVTNVESLSYRRGPWKSTWECTLERSLSNVWPVAKLSPRHPDWRVTKSNTRAVEKSGSSVSLARRLSDRRAHWGFTRSTTIRRRFSGVCLAIRDSLRHRLWGFTKGNMWVNKKSDFNTEPEFTEVLALIFQFPPKNSCLAMHILIDFENCT